MPGNPLPTIEINASRWPYDENGPVNGKFGEVAVTAAPKAVFDASVPGSKLDTKGSISFKNGDNYPRTEVPGHPGEFGYLASYNAKPDYHHDNSSPEIFLEHLTPTPHFYEYITYWQPANYDCRAAVEVTIPDIGDISDWQVGDTLTTDQGYIAKVAQIARPSNPTLNSFIIIDYTGSHGIHWENHVITNDRTGSAVTGSDARTIGFNNKFSIHWVDDEFTGGNDSGYANAAFNVECIADHTLFGSTKDKVAISDSNYENGKGDKYGGVPGGPSPVIIWDKKDNDTKVEFVIYRERGTEAEPNTGKVLIWKKTNHVNGDYPDWTLIYRNTTLQGYTTPEPNVFSRGYLLGWANTGYRVQTDFYLQRYEYWIDHPDFLPALDLGA